MATWERAWALKVMGYIHLTQLYLAAMRARGFRRDRQRHRQRRAHAAL